MAVLFGNIAQDGCVVKTAGVAPELWHFEGPAVVFDAQEDACAGIDIHDPKARIAYWLERADSYAREWKPSEYLFLDD